MKLKLKQSNTTAKQLLLPYLKSNHPRNYTPRHRPNNRSLTKIPQLPQHQPHAHPPLRPKIMSYDKPQRMQKMKSAHQKKKIQTPAPNHDDTFTSSNQLEQASIQEITYNLKKEIEKNLVFIKKEKENRKKMGLMAARPRYRTPRHQTQQNETINQILMKPNKCVTEEHEVFAKINQIITKSQSKSRHIIIEEPAPISYSSYISKGKLSSPFASIEDNTQYSKPVKTEPTCAGQNRHSHKQIKNSHNYHEWRKVSIDQGENSKMVSYNLSSYDNEADRLEKIRNKNELSLKKYIQGKSYLSKLIKYRDSANLLPKEK